jgi:hypothetical protein
VVLDDDVLVNDVLVNAFSIGSELGALDARETRTAVRRSAVGVSPDPATDSQP